MHAPLQGHVWWVDFAEIDTDESKVRPAVVVSNNITNVRTDRVQVMPCSTRTQKLCPCEVVLEIAGKFTKAMADRLQTIPKTRLVSFIRVLNTDEMDSVVNCIAYQMCPN